MSDRNLFSFISSRCLPVLLSLVTLLCVRETALAETYAAPASQDFWVWDLTVMPPGFRKAHATLQASGPRSYIYVEDKLWGTNVTADYVARLSRRLERAAPASAVNQNIGIVPLEEKIFAPLPKKVGTDDHLIVLFADLGQYKEQKFDGFFNIFDQLTEAEAWSKYKQHSNEANLIYLNGFRGSEDYTTAVVAHELQHLLATNARPAGEEEPDTWFSEMLAEGAMLLTGYFTDQPAVTKLAQNPAAYPLVTTSYVQYGPQLLFASYLLDSITGIPNSPIGALTHSTGDARKAVEAMVARQSGTPITFDVIFGNFVSYVFSASSQQTALPTAWSHDGGIKVPWIKAAYSVHAASASIRGSLAPYSFLAVDLDDELPPDAVVEVKRYDDPHIPALPGSCASSASVLWKPISLRRIAIYSVGCEPTLPNDKLQFELSIRSGPAL